MFLPSPMCILTVSPATPVLTGTTAASDTGAASSTVSSTTSSLASPALYPSTLSVVIGESASKVSFNLAPST